MTVKQLLRAHFPELGTDADMNGGDVVMELAELYQSPEAKKQIQPGRKEFKPKFKFETHAYADISTRYLERHDLTLIQDEMAPFHLANLDSTRVAGFGSPGSIFWIPDECWSEAKAAFLEHGFSKRFVSIMHELFKQGIPYARFDADGGPVDGLGAADQSERCACGNSLANGEGYDGKCGSCADKAERKRHKKNP
jgi:hypothetical protein